MSTATQSPIASIVTLPDKRETNTSRFWRAFRRNHIALVGLVVVGIMAFFAVFADVVAPYSPNEPHYTEVLNAPSAKYFLGTDELGRDIFSRLIYGARISLVIGFVAQSVALTLGITIGLISGWYSGWIDDLLMRLADIFFAIPGLMFLIVWITIFDASTINIFLALGLISWSGNARMMRSQVLGQKALEYVTAAQSLGASVPRILFFHILPNAIAPMIVLASLGVAGAILSEATLSFLGLGVQIPTPSWGTMVNNSGNYITTAWWYAMYPGLTIMLTVLGFNFIGDGLRDALLPSK